MTPKLPESAFIFPPHKVEGTPKDARASFYELAKGKIKYLNSEKFMKWQIDYGELNFITQASAIIASEKTDNFEKWIHGLEIVINKDKYNINGKDYSDIIPFDLEHEIYEAWLRGKRGVGSDLDSRKKHLLAQRRAYLVAEKQGLGDKLFEHDMMINPRAKEEYEYASKAAKKQLGYLKKRKD